MTSQHSDCIHDFIAHTHTLNSVFHAALSIYILIVYQQNYTQQLWQHLVSFPDTQYSTQDLSEHLGMRLSNITILCGISGYILMELAMYPCFVQCHTEIKNIY